MKWGHMLPLINISTFLNYIYIKVYKQTKINIIQKKVNGPSLLYLAMWATPHAFIMLYFFFINDDVIFLIL